MRILRNLWVVFGLFFIVSQKVFSGFAKPKFHYSRMYIAVDDQEDPIDILSTELGAVIDQEACPILINAYLLNNYLLLRNAAQEQLINSDSSISQLVELHKRKEFKDAFRTSLFSQPLIDEYFKLINSAIKPQEEQYGFDAILGRLSIDKKLSNKERRLCLMNIVTFLQTPFLDKNWLLFHVPNTKWIVLVPKKYLKLKGISLPLSQKKDEKLGLQLTKLERKTLPSSKTVSNFSLIEWVSGLEKSSNSEVVEDWNKIFVTPKTNEKKSKKTSYEPWNIFLSGHGSIGGYICGLSIDEFKKVLKFFNNKIRTNLFYYVSCYAGGKNVKTVYSEGFDTGDVFNYTVVVGSSTDETVTVDIGDSAIRLVDGKIKNTTFHINDFFGGLDNMRSANSTTLENILLGVTDTDVSRKFSSLGSGEMSANIPLVRYPNVPVFQVSKISADVQVITNVILTARKLSKAPINVWYKDKKDGNLKGRIALMIYPIYIDVPLNLIMKELEQKEEQEFLGEPSMKYFLDECSNAFKEDFRYKTKNSGKSLLKYYPGLINFLSINEYIIKKPTGEFVLNDKKISNFKLSKFIYPRFILKGSSPGVYFRKIDLVEVDDYKRNGYGVMYFISNVLLPLKNAFYIKELKGFNDLGLLLEYDRLKIDMDEGDFSDKQASDLTKRSLLERALNPKLNDTTYSSKPIILKNVVVSAKVEGKERIIYFEVDGIDKKSWMLQFWFGILTTISSANFEKCRNLFDANSEKLQEQLQSSLNLDNKVGSFSKPSVFVRAFNYLKTSFNSLFGKTRQSKSA